MSDIHSPDKLLALAVNVRGMRLDAFLVRKPAFVDLQMVLETRAGLEAGVVSSGHAMAAARLDAQRSIAGWASEQIGGLSYLNYVRELSQRIDSDWEGIQQDLEVGMLLMSVRRSMPPQLVEQAVFPE